jgi:hypothetical protein
VTGFFVPIFLPYFKSPTLLIACQLRANQEKENKFSLSSGSSETQAFNPSVAG